MHIQRIAAFSQGRTGGNPAGVVLLDTALTTDEMANIAAAVGYSETAFAVRDPQSAHQWRVRYFSPESEVPFCGHATIALGAALGEAVGPGRFDLTLTTANISVEAETSPTGMVATLTSPPTKSDEASPTLLAAALGLFGLSADDLDPRLPPAWIHGGANHLVLPLAKRETLAAMAYDLAAGRVLMRDHDLVTIMLVHIENDRSFNARNAFASGGVLEDPATGAAAAAFAGYLRDRHWPHGGSFTIRQGVDMGSPSEIRVTLTDEPGAPIRLSGTTRTITP